MWEGWSGLEMMALSEWGINIQDAETVECVRITTLGSAGILGPVHSKGVAQSE